MSKFRVHEIAKKLGMKSADLVAKLEELGYEGKKAVSMLDESEIKEVAAVIREAAAKKNAPVPGGKVTLAKTVQAASAVKPVAQKVVPRAAVKTVPAAVKAPAPAKTVSTRPAAPKAPVKTKSTAAKPETKAVAVKPALKKSVKAKEPEVKVKPEVKEEVAVEVPKPKVEVKPEVPAVPEGPKPIFKVTEVTTVAELASKLKMPVSELIKKIMSMGMMVTINQKLDKDSITLVAAEFNYDVEFVSIFNEETKEEEIVDASKLEWRPPVVTVMGHVDHGKTSLLDAIRETNVTAGEAGGITQHIGAYKVKTPKGEIVFLDTPGHEAFTAMRARGASVTDIVVLVVAADDGVMPQTVEAIDHAKAAKVPIIVAMNKTDKPGANLERLKQELSKYELVPEDWGGKTIFVPVSAKKKEGIDNLLSMIILEAEMLELKAVKEGRAKGVVLEAKLDKGKGSVVTVLIEKGTLKVGDSFVAGFFFGKIKAMLDDKGRKISEVIPPSPVEILGSNGVPNAGDTFQVMVNEKAARQVSARRNELQREINIQKQQHISLEGLYTEIQDGKLKDLKIVLKGDVQGSIDALTDALEKLGNDKVKVSIIHRGVGNINESDIMLASASNAIVIGFSVSVSQSVTELARKESVDLKLFRIIYEITDSVKAAMEGMLEPILKEVVVGKAEIKQVIKIPDGFIAGSHVSEGKITRQSLVRIKRGAEVVREGKITSLRRFKDDVKEVAAGYECGISVDKFSDYQVGDVFEAYIIEKTFAKL
ncbi:MAG: translation initiation factor IF-2 [Candidatus Firestonebacteria bacterium]